jgi:uncharacterized protein YndB with AHSA1/START domain
MRSATNSVTINRPPDAVFACIADSTTAPQWRSGGAKAGWWTKCVQLDLEAKGTVVRKTAKPLRWHRA